MMPKTRFFPNKLQDYNPSSGTEISKDAWREHINSIVNAINNDVCRSMSCDGGLYVGSAGVAYMLWYISSHPLLSENKSKYLELAQSIYKANLQYSTRSKPADAVSFVLGAAGVYTLGALLGSSLQAEAQVGENAQRYQSLASICVKPRFLSCGSDELFVGRAGYLCGTHCFQKKLGFKVVNDDTLNAICAVMVQSGREYAAMHRSPSPLMYAYYDTEYLGAAHGLCSILQMLLCCPSFLASDPQAARDIKRSVDWLLSLQQPNGNFVPATDELLQPRPEGEELVHWCHGAPGLIYLFAKAYKVWGEERYLQACVKCGEVTWQKGLLKKGPGICHGVAGSGYVFLLLYRLTKEEKYLHRAHEFAKFMLTQEFQSVARTPDSPYSLYEGWAGTVCFLVDLLRPEKAEFPFFDVF
ncbi:lanC-like protein 3 isoform X2 [Aplysia californica]|nr:lanC-like protein 3 isoform X2 [Aplysia californica]XP_005108705.1 lanC-like protein 3 isoform X2 [Aplysia californica]XP_005108706.1 lanC-like protein 3 isoform X2 [Aplysia californica]XP_012943676.1 lanC-like protein 3 isoform X2 [Aplysia californica]XP_035828373.1 lanC-like protein 3 isoform X2 [Aplysia californica]XP_035828374.1 lanC-like protein 3 isoform X2 [Aplysia californica]